MSLVNIIDRALPQTQCEQCGFEGCLPYAVALSNNETVINRCPPGGLPVLKALATILNTPEIPLDESCGIHEPLQVVYIEEPLCIGCTKCIQACPVDAIVGAKKMMHTIIRNECTGCALCIPPCPLDCIIILPLNIKEKASQIGLSDPQKKRAEKSRMRFNARKSRIENRSTITKTLPPQEKKLAERTTLVDMQSLIAKAKKEALNKALKQEKNLYNNKLVIFKFDMKFEIFRGSKRRE